MTPSSKGKSANTLAETTLSFSAPAPKLDIDALTAEITEAVTKRIAAEFEGKLQVALTQLQNTSSDLRRDALVITGKDQYTVASDSDGLSFNKDEKLVFLVGKNGQLSTGTRSPRTIGRGSAHFKAGYNSEAVIPSSGDGSTRGIIVEGDGDDDKSFVLRAVSRMNRQGVNVFSDGSLGLGTMKKIHDATLSVYHRHNDLPAVGVHSPNMSFEDTLFKASTSAPMSKNWNGISIVADLGSTRGYETELFRVSGQGDTHVEGSVYTNLTGYAEFFEWADGNHRDENRFGFTVALNEKGQLIVADEGDTPVGVVVPGAAFVANSSWNKWHKKFLREEDYTVRKKYYDIVEWLEMETTTVKSYEKSSLDRDFALPENAVEIQTDQHGNDLFKPMMNQMFEHNTDYVGRQERSEWACVCIMGTVPVFKGQITNKNWIRVRDISDELELMIVK